MAFAENKIDVLKKIKASKSFEDLEKLRLYYLGKKGLIPEACLLYTSPSPRDQRGSRMASSA